MPVVRAVCVAAVAVGGARERIGGVGRISGRISGRSGVVCCLERGRNGRDVWSGGAGSLRRGRGGDDRSSVDRSRNRHDDSRAAHNRSGSSWQPRRSHTRRHHTRHRCLPPRCKTPSPGRRLKRDPGNRRHSHAVRRARIRVHQRGAGRAAALAGCDLARDVHLADEHVWVVVEGTCAGAGDLHGCAVHVEFVAVTGDGDPGPVSCVS